MPRAHVAPPSFKASDFGLLSVVDARWPEGDPHWRQGVEWQPLCGTISTSYDPCNAVTGTGGPPPLPPLKSSNLTYEDRGANPFTVVADFKCSPAAFAEHAQELGEEALTRLESYEVERTFWTGVAGNQPVVYPHLAADAEVTEGGIHPVLLQTAATPVTGAVLNIVEALGLLEQALADCYNGRGVIHVPASLGPLLHAAGLVEEDGRRLRTLKGNLVALGAGYPGTGPDGSPPPSGAVWIYATGAVFAYRSGVEIMPLSSIVNRANNDIDAIAERTYVLGWDCCHLAVQAGTDPFLGSDSGALTAAEFNAEAPLVWDPGTETMSLEAGSDGQYLGADGGQPVWETPGQPGNLPGPLDGSGKVPQDQLPPVLFHTTFEAPDQATMLAEPAEAPSLCIRTDFSPPHLFFLSADPATDINNWHDLGNAASSGADPAAQVGLTAVNGVAATYMRSDAAPALSEAIVPTWTSKHTFDGGVQIPTGAAAGLVAKSNATGDVSWGSLGKADVGLGNVDNTSDASKPVSTATQAALNLKFTTPTPLIPKVVFGTTLSTNVAGLVGYSQDPDADTLAMRGFGGTTKTGPPADPDDAATKLYVDNLIDNLPGPTGDPVWGDITGALANQTDLNTALSGKVAKAGDTMTGPLLVDQNVPGMKARLAMKLPGTQQDAPTTFGVNATYLGLGGGEWNANSYRLIGFGYIGAAGNEYPGVIGYQETSTSSNTHGDLVFGVRPNNNNVAPTIAFRVRSDGQLLAEAGAAYTPSADGSLTTRKYVHDLLEALPAPTGTVLVADKASQAQAEAGTDDTKWMTPLKTAQAITAQVHGGATGVDVYVLGSNQDFTDTTPTIVADFSQIVLDETKTQVRLIEGDLYISGAHEAGIKFWFQNLLGTITYSGSAIMPDTDVDNAQMICSNYDPAPPGDGFRYDPSDAVIRKVTFTLFVTSQQFGGVYGSLQFIGAQQTSFGSPVTIHAGSKLTSRLISST